MITFIGCGTEADDISRKAWEKMQDCHHLVFQTEKMDIFKQLDELRGTQTCDDIYQQAEDFDLLAQQIYKRLRELEGDVCYAVFGSALDDTAVQYALLQCKKDQIPFCVMAGVSLADKACAACGYVGSKRVLTAVESAEATFDPKETLCITGIDDALLAGRIKCRLLDKYDGEHTVQIYSDKKTESMPLYLMDRFDNFGHTAALLVPAVPFEKLISYNTDDLLNIMSRLRAFDGCPWDREQTHRSLCRYLIEEAYEVADAVANQDPYELADELGDVLLQVVFHAQIAKEHADFTYDDSVNAVCKKMIERHPHIFGTVKADTAQEVLSNWESIKREQRGQTHSDVLKNVVRSLPALMRAEKVGDKARHAGFDFADAKEALAKLKEEVNEFVAEMDDPQSQRAFDEMGDLLFAAVNVARKCGIQPEMALNKSTDKFVRRFCALEDAVTADGKELQELNMETLDKYWEQVKMAE